MKKVLVLCTGNSCRSIIAEALINRLLHSSGIEARSAGSRPAGRVHPLARRLLQEYGLWEETYRSKTIDEALREGPYDLAVTVCDNARESCPVLPGIRTIHLPFDDPDGRPYDAFIQTKETIEAKLIPLIEKELS